MTMRTITATVVCIAIWSTGWAIATEGRNPNERPSWWKEYENAPAIEVSPQAVAPKGDVPSVVDEAVTRYAPSGVPQHLVITPSTAAQHGTAAQNLPTIDSTQVLREAERQPASGAQLLGRGVAILAVFLLIGGSAAFGIVRWLSQQLPEPPQPSRRRRF